MNGVSLQEIAAACGGEIKQAGGGVAISGVSKDTRTIQPGDLYIALRGENHDGNGFVADAANRGASGIIAESDPPAGFPAVCAYIRVQDGLAALQALAGWWRDQLSLRVICITGSNGKTSTKEFAAAILSSRLRVTKTIGNLNNHIGLPMTILAAEPGHAAAVWEIGMNHPGEIRPLAQLARPDVGIVTNIGLAHIEHLGSQEAIAHEKGELLAALHPGGIAVLDADDPFFPRLAQRPRARVVTSGLTSAAEVTARGIRWGLDGMEFELVRGGDSAPCRVKAFGEHMVRNALLAAAAAAELDLSLREISEGLSEARMAGGRLEHKLIQGIHFLDDSYNANPDSMEAALDTMKLLPAGKRIAVLGKMGELGSHAEEGYARVGLAAARVADVLVCVGAETAPLYEAAMQNGLRKAYLVAPDAAAGLLREIAEEGDLVLLKGSRTARMEEVLKQF